MTIDNDNSVCNSNTIGQPTAADLFQAIMVELWEGNFRNNNPTDGLDFYNTFHDATLTANKFGAKIVERINSDEPEDNWLVYEFRDGSRINIGPDGGHLNKN